MVNSINETSADTAVQKEACSQSTPCKHLNGSGSDILTIDQVCDILSISLATAKNWIKLGKLTADTDGVSFSRAYIENLSAEIRSENGNRLKSRRNKKSVNGKILYKDYIKNESNREAVKRILTVCEYISEEELRILLAHFAVQLYSQSRGFDSYDPDWIYKCLPASKDSIFNSLISDLLGNTDLQRADLTNIGRVLDCRIEFVPYEDTLGFIYISLRDLGQRKQKGAYYTPAETVNLLIDSLSNRIDLKNKTIFDPCCGTGNFLIGLLGRGLNSNNLSGWDIDEISILITRINMFLLDGSLTKELLASRFVCGNTLENTFNETFSVVLGNPPWGYDYSKKETEFFKDNFRTAQKSTIESYNLFIEKGLELLENDGYMAYVLPEALMNVASHLQARELLIEKTSFRFVSYLGNAFSGVQCPAVILGVQNGGQGSARGCGVSLNGSEFTIAKDRSISASVFTFNMNDDEYDCLEAIGSVKNARYLAGSAKFALGIVTGNNQKYIKNTKDDGYETVLKGSDILRYSVKDTDNFIKFTPEAFQQTAPAEIYRADEKLLYRFICDVPVFAYDNKQTLSLNSCNILIPQIEGMDIKYVMAVLNSRAAAYFINKKFNSVKLLRSHIEAVPIPAVNAEKQRGIVKKADRIMNSKENIRSLYEDIDNDIMDIFGLSDKHKEIIQASFAGTELFIA